MSFTIRNGLFTMGKRTMGRTIENNSTSGRTKTVSQYDSIAERFRLDSGDFSAGTITRIDVGAGDSVQLSGSGWRAAGEGTRGSKIFMNEDGARVILQQDGGSNLRVSDNSMQVPGQSMVPGEGNVPAGGSFTRIPGRQDSIIW